MESKENEKQFQKLSRTLRGSDGIVYLMFIGRDTYANKIQPSLVGPVFKNNANVNQAVTRLLKHKSEFLVFKRKFKEKGRPGRAAEIYTANFNPIFKTLRALNVEFDENELRISLEHLSQANDSFPQYLDNMFQTSIILQSPWYVTLSNFFHYLSQVLVRMRLDAETVRKMEQVYSILPAKIPIEKEKVEGLLSKYPGIAKKLASISIIITLPKFKLNPELRKSLVNTLPDFDENVVRIISALSEVIDLAKMLKSLGIKNIESAIKLMRELRETEEFLKWKSQRKENEAKE